MPPKDRSKLPPYDLLAAHYLRRGLQRHPDIATHVSDVDSLEEVRLLGLMDLARKMRIDDVDSLIRATEEDDDNVRRYSDTHPAFNGQLEFDLTIEIFGQRVTRKARADYEFTPEWPYHDPNKKAPFEGWPGSSLKVEFLNVPEKDGDLGEPAWDHIDTCKSGRFGTS